MRRQQIPKPRPLCARTYLVSRLLGGLGCLLLVGEGLPICAGDEHGVGALVVGAGHVLGGHIHVDSAEVQFVYRAWASGA